MAADHTDHVSWFLAIDRAKINHLCGLRAWPNLQVAFADEQVWVTGFTAADIDSVAVQAIPHKWLYYQRGGQLFPRGSLLPARPFSGQLWTPIARALPVELPGYNHHFFGLAESLDISLQPADNEQPAVAMMTTLPMLARYVLTAPAVRLRAVQWTVLDQDKVLVLGVPLLPVPGEPFWQKLDWLLPVGFDTKWPVLDETLNAKLNPDGTDWLIWQATTTGGGEMGAAFFRVPKADLMSLSIRSFRLTAS
ncbi:hypothetical protein [Fibrella aquatilis]|uniref:MoxR-vWA-beta-propeller ternary system domain-containing protein n=1 Tax=Fibrella aquatilis TaxID=2817059 RepID=A0A939JWD8_9BACT|nr:hypothetical protein [Fibrella aquatilis]MBO0931807.1 hypothetical protein [Fibrella aquatilis]